MNKKNLYCLIMAGGQGTRLWPLSRLSLPKQLIPFDKQETLLNLTIKRIEDLAEQQNRWIMTTQEYKQTIEQQTTHAIGNVLAEPSTRNTGPAILYACLELFAKDPEAVCIFLPADHYIKDEKTFRKALETASQCSIENQVITLLGLKPTHPATGYGYIEYEDNSSSECKKIKNFHEKPDIKMAEAYIKNPHMLWNIGIFCGPVKVFIEQYKKHAPALYNEVQNFLNGKQSYDALQNISVDHAIMEKSDAIYVLPAQFDWSDVGNLDTFLSLQANKLQDSVINIDSHDNLVCEIPEKNNARKKIIALIGIKDLCIVDTEDALLIAHKDEVEKVKALQAELKIKKLHEYL